MRACSPYMYSTWWAVLPFSFKDPNPNHLSRGVMELCHVAPLNGVSYQICGFFLYLSILFHDLNIAANQLRLATLMFR